MPIPILTSSLRLPNTYRVLTDGKFRVEIHKDFSKALVITQLLKHQWCLYHEAWDVIWNNTDELFLTSDNPNSLDYNMVVDPAHRAICRLHRGWRC